MRWPLSTIILAVVLCASVLAARRVIDGLSVVGLFTTILAWLSKSPISKDDAN